MLQNISLIETYCEANSSSEPAYLEELRVFTYQQLHAPNMLSGHLQGRFLSAISKMIAPKAILEIGTYSGYSALCLAEGLVPGGRLITIDSNTEIIPVIEKAFKNSPFANQIEFISGQAINVIKDLHQIFDLIFIDADKGNYESYLEASFQILKPGGWILADNTLWKGKVISLEDDDKITNTIKRFNQRVAEDSRLEKVLIPIRDGLTLIRKII